MTARIAAEPQPSKPVLSPRSTTRRLRQVSSQTLAGSVILEQTAEYYSQYARPPYAGELEICALFTASFHAFDASATQLYPLIASPIHASGKTRLAQVMRYTMPAGAHHWQATSAAAVYETIDKEHTPIILENIDEVMAPGSPNRQIIKQLLDSANARGGAKIPKMRVIDGVQIPVEFDVYSPLLLTARDLTKLPADTVSRCAVIPMERERTNYRWNRATERKAERDGAKLRGPLAAWLLPNLRTLENAVPDIPEELEYIQGGRTAESLNLLLAIADLAGDKWPKLARETLTRLIMAHAHETDDIAVRLLNDIRKVFGDSESMSTRALLIALTELEGEPWAEKWGDLGESASGQIQVMNQIQRAATMGEIFAAANTGPRSDSGRAIHSASIDFGKMLRPFHIRDENSSGKVRVNGGPPVQGFRRTQFIDAWRRYL